MPSLRILYVAPIDLSLPAGHALHARRLVEALTARGHRVHLVSLAPARPLEWDGEPQEHDRVARAGDRHLRQWSFERSLARAVRQALRTTRPDVLHLRQELFTLLGAFEPPELPFVVESNCHLAALQRDRGAPRWRIALAARLESMALRNADAYYAVTPRILDTLRRDYRLDAGRGHVVRNGAHLPALEPHAAIAERRALGVPDDAYLLAYFGAGASYQRLPSVFASLARIREPFRLWVGGEGPEHEGWERSEAARTLGTRVRFLGGMSEARAELRAQAAQLLLAPFDDGWIERNGSEPLKVLSALAADRPVALTQAPPVELYAGLGGLLVPDWDRFDETVGPQIAAWRAAGAPLEGWPWLVGGGPGRKYVAEQRTWERSAIELETVYAAAIATCARGPRSR